MTQKRPTILDGETAHALELYGGGWTLGRTPDRRPRLPVRHRPNETRNINRKGDHIK